MFNGLFDIQFRFEKIDANGDPLVTLNEVIDWELFRPILATLRDKPRKSNAGAKGYDPVLMFKVLVLKSLYNLSDDQTEAQILDRLSFMRFLGLTLGDKVPDAKTIWVFNEDLAQAGLAKEMFDHFETFLKDQGFAARKGQIVDASIVNAPKQRNPREVNQKIKAGEPIEDWSDNKRRRKDVDARWTRKNNQNYFGYKNHVNVDVQHKLIRRWAVTPASTHDKHPLDILVVGEGFPPDIWGDSAYGDEQTRETLKTRGFQEHLNRKGTRTKTLTEEEKQANRERSRTRVRVEHVFGHQAQKATCLLLRGIGIVRARCKIGLRNLTYNLQRYVFLETAIG